MSLPRSVVWTFSLGMVSAAITDLVSGQSYPSKPIRIITSQPGASSDLIARMIAQGISGPLGQPVIIDNRGSAVLPGIFVAKANPDGHTLVVSTGVLWTGTFVQKVSYDPIKDFAPITLAVSSPNLLIVHPSVPAKSVKEFIALAKSKPGQLNYASAGNGGSAHLGAELFKNMAGIDLTLIPYTGAGPALNALMGNEVQMLFTSTTSSMPHVKAGRLRALAITTLQPSALAPDLPTVASSVPKFEWTTITGVLAPAKTPEAIVRRLNQEIVRVLGREDVQEKFFNMGAEAVGTSPEQFAAIIKSEMIRMAKLIKDAGIRAD